MVHAQYMAEEHARDRALKYSRRGLKLILLEARLELGGVSWPPGDHHGFYVPRVNRCVQ